MCLQSSVGGRVQEDAEEARLRTSVTSRRYTCAFEHTCILVSGHVTSTSTHTQRSVVVRVDPYTAKTPGRKYFARLSSARAGSDSYLPARVEVRDSLHHSA